GESNSIGRHHGANDFAADTAICPGVAHKTPVHVTLPGLAKICKPKPPVHIEHEVVRPAQRPLIRVRVQRCNGACLQVDRLNAAPLVVATLESRHHGTPTPVPLEPSIVADIAPPVRTNRRAIRTTAT